MGQTASCAITKVQIDLNARVGFRPGAEPASSVSAPLCAPALDFTDPSG